MKSAITAGTGFIGSNLVESLLKSDNGVTGLDNFSTDFYKNLDEEKALVLDKQWARFNALKAISVICLHVMMPVPMSITSFIRPLWIQYLARLKAQSIRMAAIPMVF